MAVRQQREFQFDLTGGHIALDMANTISRREDAERRREHLESYSDLVAFAVQDRILSAKQANTLLLHANRNNASAVRSFRKAIVLREAIYRVFRDIAQRRPVRSNDLLAINNSALQAVLHRQLSGGNGSYRWEWQTNDSQQLDRILWPIAQAAADLLTSDELKLVRWCEAPDCEWLFLDHSRNRSRRWCDMTSCGNRAKARRHYQRTRE
jgi:predicted RNA-binding Zn ribbon-like protein